MAGGSGPGKSCQADGPVSSRPGASLWSSCESLRSQARAPAQLNRGQSKSLGPYSPSKPQKLCTARTKHELLHVPAEPSAPYGSAPVSFRPFSARLDGPYKPCRWTVVCEAAWIPEHPTPCPALPQRKPYPSHCTPPDGRLDIEGSPCWPVSASGPVLPNRNVV